jgi:hypothetical protein
VFTIPILAFTMDRSRCYIPRLEPVTTATTDPFKGLPDSSMGAA